MHEKENNYHLDAVDSNAVPLSCDTDFLNTNPLDRISSEVTWTDGPFHRHLYIMYTPILDMVDLKSKC